MVQTSIKLGFVENTNGLVHKVVSGTRVVGVRRGIQVHHRLSNVVDQAGRDLVAGSSVRLASVRI